MALVTHMSRNLVIACDGTNNEFGIDNTNVVRLIQCLDRQPDRQLIYYDPGVGTLPEPGFVSKIGKFFSTIAGLAFGAGLTWKVTDAYQFLMAHWQPEDRVYIYGFSRGAYTARVLAGFLHMFGLLSSGSETLVPYAMRLYKAARERLDDEEDASAFWRLCTDFRNTFARDVPGRADSRFPVRFLGLWDTVSSVGWLWDPARFPFSAANPSVNIVRHAVSIDERRWFFRQNLLRTEGGQDFKEQWFTGAHADVGGGYHAAGSALWQESLRWMIEEARGAGLLVDSDRERAMWKRYEIKAEAWRDPKHESLTLRWWPAEIFPKMQYWPQFCMSQPAMGLGRRRRIPEEAVAHESALKRMHIDPRYAPNAPQRWRIAAQSISLTPPAVQRSTIVDDAHNAVISGP
jgi:uncharacterized protein (DUF2235 family)